MTHVADSPVPAPTVESWSFAEAHSPIADGLQQAWVEAVQAGLIPVNQGVASALTVPAKTMNARIMVEIGTALSTFALPLLTGMTSDGVLTSIDSEADDQLPARPSLNVTGYPPFRCRLTTGALLEILPKLRDDVYNIVFISDDKLEYVEYVAAVLRLLHLGGLLVIRDVLWYNTVADPGQEGDETIITRGALDAVRAANNYTTTLLTVGNGLLVAAKD